MGPVHKDVGCVCGHPEGGKVPPTTFVFTLHESREEGGRCTRLHTIASGGKKTEGSLNERSQKEKEDSEKLLQKAHKHLNSGAPQHMAGNIFKYTHKWPKIGPSVSSSLFPLLPMQEK